jgi:amino acid transporter
MGRAGTLPASFGRIHPTHLTPAVAIGVAQIVGMMAILLVGLMLRPEYIFNFLGTIATLAVIVIYVMANLALTRYMRRDHRAYFSIWLHVLVPTLATLVLAPVLFLSVYPLLPWPYNLTPYLFMIMLAAGFVYMQWREWRNPGTLHRSAVMIMRGKEGEAEALQSVSTKQKGYEVLEMER